jgi:Xaa-Pro aminopeptidase
VTVAGRGVPDEPDVVRMRADRHGRLQAGLERQGIDGLLLLGTGNVSYATGAMAPGTDSGRASLLRPVALVVRGDPAPHLFTPYPEGAPPELPADHLHRPLWPDLDEGAALVAAVLGELLPPGAQLATDEQPHPILGATAGAVPAAAVLGPAKLTKTADELACIRRAQHINEQAMADVQPHARPGTRQTDLSARFLRRIFELGAHSDGIDPIWQVLPLDRADGPWTTNGDIAFPTPTTDRFLREGDVVWVDSGLHWEGYASDFGRTWLVSDDPSPTPRQQAQHRRWCEVVAATLERCRPGASGRDLTAAAIEANGGTKPWLDHFYLAHGVGTDSAEMPMIGTDLGEAFDEQLVLEPGMVLVIEPVIWDDGAAGYRAEDIIAITDDGWLPLSDHPYEPFGAFDA